MFASGASLILGSVGADVSDDELSVRLQDAQVETGHCPGRRRRDGA